MKTFTVLLVLVSAAHADDREARTHYERAVRAYNILEWATALDEFRGAYVEKTDPALLYNIAQCQRQLGQYEAAAKSYRAFLNQAHPGDDERAKVEAFVRQMDDAARLPRLPVPPPVVVAPEVVSRPSPSRPWYKRPVGMSLALGGAAVAIAGGALLGQGAADYDSARHAGTLPEQQRLQDSSNSFNAAGWIVIGVGAATLGVGAIVWVIGR
jgi:tetratricopeptide (TPR) repeat protein